MKQWKWFQDQERRAMKVSHQSGRHGRFFGATRRILDSVPAVGFAVLAAASCFHAWAQNIAIDWFVVSGGGGASTNAVYQVNGTIGQPMPAA
jgi:hypothetical protein